MATAESRDIARQRWNRLGFKTLFLKEVRRWMKVWGQTVFSPLITTSLYFLVFGVALGSRLSTIDGVPYIEFVIPGLVMLAMISNSFLNTASSLFQSKINQTITDILVAPLGTVEIILAYVSAAVVRALLVGALVYSVAVAFVGARIAHPLWTLAFAVGVAVAFSLAGMIIAIWAEKYDHLSFFPSFVLTPLTFLGGVFYSVDMLPAPWDTISRFNPILYMVNGLRYGLLGVSDVDVRLAFAAVALMAVVMFVVAWRMLESGYKLRE